MYRVETVNYQLPTDSLENRNAFKEAYDDFAIATQLTTEDDAIQALTLKTVLTNPFVLRTY